jgi:hypothetical protein
MEGSGSFLLAIGLLCLPAACGGGGNAPQAGTGFTRASGPPGTAITLSGAGLADLAGASMGGQPIAFDPATATLWVDEQVPAGPQTLLLQTAGGDQLPAPGLFTVTVKPPSLLAVSPGAAAPGQAVSLLGDDFGLAPSVTVGGVPAPILGHARGEISILVPAGAGSGAVAVTQAETGAVGLAAFSLVSSAALAPRVGPALPPSGAVGSSVLILVESLTVVNAVRFGAVPATVFGIAEEGVVPLSLAYAGGTVAALAEFQVAEAPPVAIGIITAFITQGTQALDGSQPLVAGRDGLLRVFVDATLPNAFQPGVEIFLQDGVGNLLLDAVLPAPGPGVPTAPMEGILADSWNLPVDGSLIQPGLRLSAYLRPEADTPGAAFHYFAGVFPDLGPAATAGLAPGGLGGQELNRSLVCFDRASTPDSEAFDNGGPTSLTHELGHLASLRHVGCGGAAARPGLSQRQGPAGPMGTGPGHQPAQGPHRLQRLHELLQPDLDQRLQLRSPGQLPAAGRPGPAGARAGRIRAGGVRGGRAGRCHPGSAPDHSRRPAALAGGRQPDRAQRHRGHGAQLHPHRPAGGARGHRTGRDAALPVPGPAARRVRVLP